MAAHPNKTLLTKTLYKSLLRVTKRYTSKRNGPILSCFLYRSGGTEDDTLHQLEEPPNGPAQESKESRKQPFQVSQRDNASAAPMKDEGGDDDHDRRTESSSSSSLSLSSWRESNPDIYRYLTVEQARDLSRPYSSLFQQRRKRNNSMQEEESQDFKTTSQVEEEEGLSFGSSLQSSVQVPLHVRVYKNLVREVIGSKTHMNVPRKIIQADTNDNVMFRLEHVIKREFRADMEPLALTQFYSEKTRQQIGFLALKELQKKLAWAESLGLDLDDDDDEDSDEEVDDPIDDDDDDDRDSSSTSSTKNGIGSSGHMNQLVASDVVPLPDHPPSCYLQPGTFLLAHPLMTGCFARTVICLLQHTPAGKGHGQPSLNHNDNYDNDDDDDVGGTYGLIVNQPLHVGVPNRNSKKVRCRTLREVIRHDCLPGSVQAAFGDVPVRNGGPVNMSIQMLRCMEKKQDVVDEIRCDFGGCHLKRAATVMAMTGVEKKDAMDEKKQCVNDVGGKNKSNGDNDCSVFFGGDVIKAAQSVLDWDTTQDCFSFVVGASCWEPGQLESEVEKGYWIPCAAPPRIAFSGSCRVKGMDDDVQMSESGLWVSMMAAIGEEEGRLAQLFEDVEYDENGFPCDDL